MRPRCWFHVPRCAGAISLVLSALGPSRAHAQRADSTKTAPLVVYRIVPSSSCPREPDPDCAEKVRRKRIYGDDVTGLIDDRREESIVARLTMLLGALDRAHPADAWSRYLSDGKPDWTRIAVSGLSQGAGMAAYIAQRTTVARVILFSSPWDNYGRLQTLAPWVRRGHGATPAERWYAAYHRNENTADVIARAYAALQIPMLGDVRLPKQ